MKAGRRRRHGPILADQGLVDSSALPELPEVPSVSAMVIRRSTAAVCGALLLAGLALPAQAQATHTAGRSVAPAADPASAFSWNVLPTGSTDQFRGLAAVDARVAWV